MRSVPTGLRPAKCAIVQNDNHGVAAASGLHRYAVIGAALLGIATLVLGVIMLFVFPFSAELTPGFRTPIIAFEFARSDADLAFLSGSSEAAASNRDSMDAGHRWDAVFPFAYAGFVAFLLLELIAGGQRWLWLAMPLALVIIPLDLQENAILLAITEILRTSGSTTALLQDLHTATWLKWGALGASIAALSIGFAIQKARTSALLSALTAFSVGWCWLSDSAPRAAESMSGATFIFFLIFAITAVARAWQAMAPRV
jgi:hypothetical protein